MTPRNPTASSLERAEHCAPSHFLPLAREGSVYADRGHGVHDFIVRWRDYLGRDRDAALAEIPEDAPHRALCEAVPLEALPEGGKLEVAFAYDPVADTARIIGYNIGRLYKEHGALPHEICGTADCVGTANGVVIIIDWKSGFGRVPKWQLRFLALAACRALNLQRARVANWFLRDDGTVREDKDSVDEFDAIDLDQIAADLRALLERLKDSAAQAAAAGGRPNVAGGAWCDYCESMPHCDLQVGLPKRALAMRLDEPMTAERASEAWFLKEMIKGWVSRMESGLLAYARVQPFADGRGNRLQEASSQRRELIAEKALPALADTFGAQVAEAACERSATQESIKRALRAHAKGKPLAPLVRKAMQVIGEHGGVVVRTTTSVHAIKDDSAPMFVLKVDEGDGSIRPMALRALGQ